VLEAQQIRQRLMNPPNAVIDIGIDLRRRFLPSPPVAEQKSPAPEIVPLAEPVAEIADDPDQPLILDDHRVRAAPLYVTDIVTFTAAYFRIPMIEFMSVRRTHNLSYPRHICMWLSKELTPRSLPYIGKRIGGRDHTTVLHGIRKIESMRICDPALQATLDDMLSKLRMAA
jgi:hypothetical protein